MLKRFAQLIPIIGILTTAAWTQNAGNVGIQTVGPQILLNAVTVPTASSVAKNIGQAQHIIEYCLTVNGATNIFLNIQLEASLDGSTNWTQVSDVGTKPTAASNCAFLQAGGYYPNVRVNLINFTYVGGPASVTAGYSAAAAPVDGTGLGAVLARRQATITAMQSNSLQAATSFSSIESVVNPGANTGVVALQPYISSTPITLFPVSLLVTCTAACSFDVVQASAGSGCPSSSTANTNTGSTNVSGSGRRIPTPGCTGAPTAGASVVPPINITTANGFATVDLSSYGIVIPFGTSTWLMVRNSAALTGTMTVNLLWYER